MTFIETLVLLLYALFFGGWLFVACEDADEERQEACNELGGILFLVLAPFLALWLFHFSSSIALCCWGSEGYRVEKELEEEKSRGQVQAG